MTKYCRQCGALLGAGLAFCTNCGAQVANLDDDSPETVIRRPIVINLSEPEPEPARVTQQPVTPQPLPSQPVKRSSAKTVFFVISGVFVAICGAAGIAALAYFLGRQASNANAQNTSAATNINSNSNQALPSNTTPTPKATPGAKTENVTGNEVCSVTAQTQLHRDCDTKDCDVDGSTAADAAAPGSQVTRLGFYKPSSHAFKWEKVSINGKELWISSTKIDCGTAKAPNQPGNKPLTNTQNPQKPPKVIPQKTPKPNDPWQGVPPNVTAICNDGTYSFTKVRMFQCSFHGGARMRR